MLAAALLFSTGGTVIKATALPAWHVAGLRSGIAAAALLAFLPAARRVWRPRHLLVGTAYAATLILFVSATKLTTAANAIFLQATAPLYVLLLGPLWLKEHVRRADLVFLATMAIGAAAFFLAETVPSATAPDPATGNALALASGLTWALTVTGLRWTSRAGADDTLVTVVAGNALAFVFCLPFVRSLPTVGIGDWAALGWLGVFQIGLAYLSLTRGMARVSALEASLLLLLEPVLNPLWTWMVQGERPAAWALGGGAIILTATVVRTLSSRPIAVPGSVDG